MNKYQTQAKVYAIRSHQTEEIYIGSTCDTLPKRFYSHKRHFKRYQNGKAHYITSFKMLEYPDARIELLENCPCNDKNELTRREGELIRANPNCVNKQIAGRTRRQYLEDNAETIKAYWKEYQQANTHKLKEKHDCPCGGKYTTANQAQHLKTKKHQKYLETV
tara:strand:- start:45 stop:533 length:489 start_codon:yes stop_codon:yes gene_type:complete